MANDDDECDSSSLLTFASQSDVNSFLQKQAAKITGINYNFTDDDGDDDDENSIDDNLLRSFTRSTNSNKRPSSLSHSCFASISSEKQNLSDDLTELKWLNTFKFKQFQDQTSSNNNQISQLMNELKLYNQHNINTITSNVSIFLAFYSKHNDSNNSWSLTIKQLYEYIQKNSKHLTNKRGWKNLLKQTLITNPCFIKTKSDISKTHSIWTIDSYYRPLLTKAYLTSASNKNLSTNEKQSESIVKNFAPKATVKTKALPRLYERLCEENAENDNDDEPDSNHVDKSISGRKRPPSVSTSIYHQQHVKINDKKCLSSSSPSSIKTNKQSHLNSNIEKIQKRSNSTESIEYESSDNNQGSTNSIRKSMISTRSQSPTSGNKTEHVHRRKSSPPKKRLSLGLITHRPNTRINKKIIEQDLELLRQAQPLDLSLNPMK